MLRSVLAVLIWASLTLGALPVTAQIPSIGDSGGDEKVVLPDPLTPETIRELVARLSDDQVRALLLERLDAVASAEAGAEKGVAVRDFVLRNVQSTRREITASLLSLPEAVSAAGVAVEKFAEPRGSSGLALWAAFLAMAVLAGWLAEMVLGRIIARLGVKVPVETPETLGQTLKVLIRRVFLEFGGLAVFIAAAGAVIWYVMPDTPRFNRESAWTLITVPFVYARLAAALGRFLLAPARPELRLVHTDDWTARFLHRHLVRLSALLGAMHFAIPFLLSHGAQIDAVRFGFWLNLAFYLYLLWVVWRTRDGLVLMLRGRDTTVTLGEEAMARAFPWFAMALIVANWLLIEALIGAKRWDLLDGRTVETLILLLCAPIIDTAARGLVSHLVPPMTGEGALAEKAWLSSKRSYIRVGRVLTVAAIILVIARLWDIDLRNLAASGVGVQFAGRLIEVVLILAVGYLVWEFLSLWINRKLAAEQTVASEQIDEEIGGEGGGAGGSRLSTVLPLLLGVLKVTVFVIFILLALGHAGVDITPLLAGAGIVGIAIGFGAQKLVADVVSGIFFLIDDAFRTGEYIEVDGTVGTVEQISIRSMQLRHHKGAVHTIPYGEIPKLTNYSRDWVIMKLRFTVPFDTDPNKVKKIFKQIGKDMMEVPEFAADMLQTFKSQGVFDFDDVGMIIRGKFMAKPGRQFVLRKEIYNRVKTAFEENGIAFARREVRVAIPGLHDANHLSDDDKASIAAAAGEAAQQAAEPAGAPRKG